MIGGKYWSAFIASILSMFIISFFFLFKGDAGASLCFFMEKVSAMWDATF